MRFGILHPSSVLSDLQHSPPSNVADADEIVEVAGILRTDTRKVLYYRRATKFASDDLPKKDRARPGDDKPKPRGKPKHPHRRR